MLSSILLIGGCTGREEAGALRSIEKLIFEQTSLGLGAYSEIVGELMEPRRSPAVLREKDSFLIIGGCAEKYRHLNSVERLRMDNERCECAALPHNESLEKRSCAAFCNLNESTGVIIGGFNGYDCLKTVELILLNREKISSKKLPDLPFRLKNGTAAVLDKCSILLFGGWDESRTMKTVFRLQFSDELDTYQANMEAILPYEVEGHCCVPHNDHIYIIGGYNGVSVIATIIRYSVAERQSEILSTRLSNARENHVCEIVFGRYLVVMAGWNGKRALDSVEVFEIANEYPYLVTSNMTITLAQARNRPSSIIWF